MTSSKAFRTLKLLEQHHEQLAKIIKFRSENPSAQAQVESSVEGKKQAKGSSRASNALSGQSAARPLRQPEVQPIPQPQRSARDVGSSIASNLASARGIPPNRQRRSGQASTPAVTQQNVEGKIVSPPRTSTLIEHPTNIKRNIRDSEKTQKAHNNNPVDKTQAPDDEKEINSQEPVATSDDPFNRFYSTFENLFSKLSAPLAFAGLPLNSDSDNVVPNAPVTQSPKPQAAPQRPKPKSRATASPEYSRLFSPAAVRALREDPGTTALNTAESFYVVPTTGGTLPYAKILARHAQTHMQALSAPSRDDHDSDEFVDAQETPGNSPRMKRKSASAVRSAGGKTLEELELENAVLRSTHNELNDRLFQFEMSSQMSQQALHQSIRAGLKASPAASQVGGQVSGDVDSRMKALERDMTSLRKENEKLKIVISKYRERWEKLKEGAKMRREGTGGLEKVLDRRDEDE